MEWNLEEAMTYYRTQGAPGDQQAQVNLLKEVQKNSGGAVPAGTAGEIAEFYGIKESFLLAVIRRYPSIRLANTHCLELCAGPNCSKRAKLAEFVEKTYGKTTNGVTIRQVPCMRMCGKGPNLRWDGKIYHQADEELIRKLMQSAEKV